ncbi:MAG: S-layer homology domain-containing protein, partial [Clostridia bacterium]|nr:S-layer homology domain-containing protein [Clostridia bacterium]
MNGNKHGLFKKLISFTLAAVMLLGILPMSSLAAESVFADVRQGDWFYDAVQYAHGHGLMQGVGGGRFSPNSNVTRAMLVTILHRLEGEPTTVAPSFTDVQKGSWYYNAVAWAAENDIVEGYPAGVFGPADDITREQFAAVMFRYASHKGYDTSARASLGAFSDGSGINAWARDAMAWANAAGLINGVSGSKLDPAGRATRAQAAAILMRFCENIAAVQTEQQHVQPETPKADEVTVTFDPNYPNAGAGWQIKAARGGTVYEHDAPDRPGFSFRGWYTAASGGERFDFNTPVTENLTLYASWNSNQGGGIPVVETYYTVTFDSNGGGSAETQTVRRGERIEQPTEPTRDRYIFTGWYTDSSAKDLYDFTASVTDNIILYAGWRSISDNLTDDVIDMGDIEMLRENGDIEVIFGEQGGVVFIDGKFTDKKVTSAEEAAELLNSASPLFGDGFIADAADISVQSNDGESFYRYSTAINGVPVIGSQIVLFADEEGNVTGLTNSYVKALADINTTPSISDEEAESIVLEELLKTDEIDGFLTAFVSDEVSLEEVKDAFAEALDMETGLVIYAADSEETPALVYAVKASCALFAEAENPDDSKAIMLDETYYIYANEENAGAVYRVISNIQSVEKTAFDLRGNERRVNVVGYDEGFYLIDSYRDIRTYRTKKTTFLFWNIDKLPGNIATIALVGAAYVYDSEAISLHANMKEVYDFYKNVLGRDSFDGKGAEIVASYAFGDNYYNAYWTSLDQRFVFGDIGKLEAAIDVVGHEFTHAVIDYVVKNGLTYYGETGALNESYADIMGMLIEGKQDGGKWLIGEDAEKSIRSFATPLDFKQPKHYDNRYLGSDDDGGVHKNSGIFNHAAYLMMTDSRTASISNATWAKVFYDSLHRLSSSATFLPARGAIIASAKKLGFNSDQQQAIKDAFESVGIKVPEVIRIVLTWGATPSDLDSHLVGLRSDMQERFHVYYRDKIAYKIGFMSKFAAELDYDDTTSFGPEITTIYSLTPGEYYFYVHDYSNGYDGNSTEMAK